MRFRTPKRRVLELGNGTNYRLAPSATWIPTRLTDDGMHKLLGFGRQHPVSARTLRGRAWGVEGGRVTLPTVNVPRLRDYRSRTALTRVSLADAIVEASDE